MTEMSDALDELRAAVTEEKTVVSGAVTLIQGLAAQLHANAEDPAAVRALADEITQSVNPLAAAITANTAPAPNNPEPAPLPEAAPTDTGGATDGTTTTEEQPTA